MRTRNKADIVFLALLAILLACPAFGLFGKRRSVSEGENRVLASPPGFGSFREFSRSFDTFVNDHFGLRDSFVRLHYFLKAHLFWEPIEKRVLKGKSGWLYYADPLTLEEYRRPETPLWLMRDLVRVVEETVGELQAKGTVYVLAVAPNKETIYPEYVPPGTINPDRRSRLQQYSETFMSLPFLDLSPVLKEKKKAGRPLYYRTDSHWTGIGAYFGYLETMRYLGEQGVTVSPVRIRESDFRPDPPGSGRGELTNNGRFGSESLGESADGAAFACIRPTKTPPFLESMQIGHAILHAFRCETGRKRIALIGDSFAEFWVRYFAATFRETLFLGRPLTRSELDTLVREYKPDVVVEAKVERFLRL